LCGDENPRATVESNFQQRFSVNVWCWVLDDQLIGTFIFDGRLTGKLLRGTRAVHNRAAACVAAGGGIFENQL
jgi:hypothetical protein